MEKYGKIGFFSGWLQLDWGNTAWAAMTLTLHYHSCLSSKAEHQIICREMAMFVDFNQHYQYDVNSNCICS